MHYKDILIQSRTCDKEDDVGYSSRLTSLLLTLFMSSWRLFSLQNTIFQRPPTQCIHVKTAQLRDNSLTSELSLNAHRCFISRRDRTHSRSICFLIRKYNNVKISEWSFQFTKIQMASKITCTRCLLEYVIYKCIGYL